MFTIKVDQTHNVIESCLSGFLSVAEVEAYAAEVEPVIRRSALRGGYRMLIDVSGCAIQAQDVALAFQRHVANVPQARRLAVVTGSSIIRMQIRRILSGPGMGLFADRAEAGVWLHRVTSPTPA